MIPFILVGAAYLIGKTLKNEKYHLGGDMSKHLAPNGLPSKLTHEQWHLVRTPEFKSWFGDWENNPQNASKVIDEETKEPMVVWHFAKRLKNEKFYEFHVDRQLGSHFGTLNQLKNLLYIDSEKGYLNPDINKKDFRFYEVFLNIKNPIRLQDVGIFEPSTLTDALEEIEKLKDSDWEYINNYRQEIDKMLIDRVKYIAKEKGYDGAIYLNRYESTSDKSKLTSLEDVSDEVFKKHIPESHDSWIAFYPEQIKLADGSNTTFDSTNPDIRYNEGGKIIGYNETLKAAGLTENDCKNWQNKNKVEQKQIRVPKVKEAAILLSEGKITQDEYLETVLKYQPIKPFTKVPKLPSLKEIVCSLNKNKVEKGILGINYKIEDGKKVATRLDIPAYENYDVWVISVHDGTKEGLSLTYGQTAVLKNVEFKTFPSAALKIATGQEKATIGRMFGEWVNEEPNIVRERAIKLMKNKNWVQVGMNPFRHSYFYDKKDSMPIISADEVIQVGALVLAKNPVKTTPYNPIFIADKKNPNIKFDKGGEVDYSNFRTSVIGLFNDGKILILQRGSTANWMPNKWSLVGGVVDEGENPKEAIIRECFEEVGLKPKNVSFDYNIMTDDSGEIYYYHGDLESDNVQLDYENSNYAFISKSEIDDYDFVPYVKKFIIKLFAKK